MKHSTQYKVKLGWLIFCLSIDTVYILMSLGWIAICVFTSMPGEAIAFGFATAIHAAVLTAMDILSVSTLQKRKSTRLIACFFMKLAIAVLMLSIAFIIIEDTRGEIGVTIFVAVMAVIIGGSTVLCSHLWNTSWQEQNKTDYIDIEINGHFTLSSAEWAWDKAAEEYCRINNTILNMLNNTDYLKILDYAGLPILYFTIWVLKNNFYQNRLKNALIATEIEKIKNETVNPTKFFGGYMCHSLFREDLSAEILPFVDSYYTNSPANSATYFNDYLSVVESQNNKYDDINFCIDFSWDIYHKIEAIINSRFYSEL